MTPWVRDSPGRRGDAARSGAHVVRRAAEPAAATVLKMRGPASPKPIRCQRSRAASSVGPFGLDDGAALVAGRPEQLLEERLGDPVRVVLRVDDQEVDGADVAAGSNGRPEREDRAPDDDALRFRDDDAGLRQVDELAHEIGCAERALATVHLHRIVTQGDDPVDVRDTGCSDQVFHADGSNLAGFGDQGPRSGSTEAIPGPAIRSSAANEGSSTARSQGAADRYCIQVAGRVIYGIASAATCAPPGCGTRQPPLVMHRRSVEPSPGEGAGDRRADGAPSGRRIRPGSSQGVSTGDLEETE